MLNFTLLYFIIISVFHIGRKYMPKLLHSMRALHRSIKAQPLLCAVAAMSCFTLLHPEKMTLSQEVLQVGGLEGGLSNLRHEIRKMFPNAATEVWFYRILGLLFAV